MYDSTNPSKVETGHKFDSFDPIRHCSESALIFSRPSWLSQHEWLLEVPDNNMKFSFHPRFKKKIYKTKREKVVPFEHNTTNWNLPPAFPTSRNRWACDSEQHSQDVDTHHELHECCRYPETPTSCSCNYLHPQNHIPYPCSLEPRHEDDSLQ